MHRDAVTDSVAPTSSTVALSPRATSLWTYGASALAAPRTTTPPPFPRIADVPADVTVPSRSSDAVTTRTPAAPLVPPQAGPAPLSPARPWSAPVVPLPAEGLTDSADSAHRSAPDDIAARATTTLIPSSPGARARSGPVFVDGSGRRARLFKGVAATAAALAAGYVGVVVTGALAGSSGPAAVPVASGASLAPATPAITPTPVLAPAPVTVQPAEVTTKKPARATTTKKTTPRAVPPKAAPKVVAPPAPVVPAPVAPVAPVVPPPAPAAPVVPAAPATPTTKNGTGQTGQTGRNRDRATPGTVTQPAAQKTLST
jgi:hypothetical protein